MTSPKIKTPKQIGYNKTRTDVEAERH